MCVQQRNCVCALAYWAPQSRVPGGRNAAITPLVKEGGRQGCWEKAKGVRERDVGKEGREDRTQLTWPITANEVRYKQRGRRGGGGVNERRGHGHND